MSENPSQPHRIVAELANGGGVIIEPLCVLCGEANEAIACPICGRVLCIELCFGVHFNARDSYDAPDRIDAFLRTPQAHNLLDWATRDVKDPKDADWRHGLTCDDCRPNLRELMLTTLVESARVAVEKP